MSPRFPRLRDAGLTDAGARRLSERISTLAARHSALARRLETELGLSAREATAHVEEVVAAVVDRLGGAYHERVGPHLNATVRLRRQIEELYEGMIEGMRATPGRPAGQLGAHVSPARLERMLDELEGHLLALDGLAPDQVLTSQAPASLDPAAVLREAGLPVRAPTPPATALPVPAFRRGLAVSGERTVALGASEAVQMIVGAEADLSPRVRAGVEAARAKPRRGSGGELEERASRTFEDAAVVHFTERQLPREGLDPAAVQRFPGTGGVEDVDFLSTDWSEGQLGSVRPDALAVGRDPATGQIVLSLAEATLQSDLAFTGPEATQRGRKLAQFAGYLSALQRIASRMEGEGRAPRDVVARVHYYSLDPPSAATLFHFEQQIRTYGFQGLVVLWHQL